MGSSIPPTTDSYAVNHADSCRSREFLVTNLVTKSGGRPDASAWRFWRSAMQQLLRSKSAQACSMSSS